jgi:hypothetical protein
MPPATATAATAVEPRKPLRLGEELPEIPEELGEPVVTAFGVIASTLRGAPGHPAETSRRSAAVCEVERAGTAARGAVDTRCRSASMLLRG